MMGFRMVERKSSSLIDGANWTYMQNYKTLVREGVGHLACSHLASLSFALKQSIRAADHPLHNPETLVHQAAHNMSDWKKGRFLTHWLQCAGGWKIEKGDNHFVSIAVILSPATIGSTSWAQLTMLEKFHVKAYGCRSYASAGECKRHCIVTYHSMHFPLYKSPRSLRIT